MEVLPNIDIVRFFHRGESRIGLKFNYNEKIIKITRTLTKARWSSSKKLWYLDDSKANLKQIETYLKDFAKLDFTSYNNTSKKQNSTKSRNLNQNQKDSLNGFYKYLKGKRYSQSTINTYTHFIADFI
ncbi:MULTISPECIES: hypothetical protein [unclassified Winogradskyella]|uniref:hypothetical protein n=1 Tax=unclassified Winogradskyella TaxID=2615021 RepID=UPI001E41EEA0|nr:MULTISPECIES: hypothetical protein [unclassified Winogradskyella]